MQYHYVGFVISAKVVIDLKLLPDLTSASDTQQRKIEIKQPGNPTLHVSDGKSHCWRSWTSIRAAGLILHTT